MDDDVVISCIRTVVVKTCWTAGIFTKFLVMRLFDLLGLILNLIASCTLIRLVPLVWMLSHCSSWKKFALKWRYGGLLQIAIFIFDIPFMVMFLCLVACPWRLVILLMYHENSEWFEERCFRKWGYIGWDLRGDIAEEFAGLLTDIFILPFSLIVFVVCPWRATRTVEIIQKIEKGEFKKKWAIIKSAFYVFCDIFFFIFYLILCFTWRLPVMIELAKDHFRGSKNTPEEKQDRDYKTWGKVFVNVFRLFLDIFMLPGFMLLIFSWRLPVVIKKFKFYLKSLDERAAIKKTGQGSWEKRGEIEWRLRRSLTVHFFRYLLDIAMLVPIAVIFCSWRCPILVLKFKRFVTSKMKRSDEITFRKSILFHFSQVIFDFFTLFPIIFTIFTWRIFCFVQIFPLAETKSLSRKFKKVRLQFWKEFGQFLLDIPAVLALLFCIIFCWCCPWRTYHIFRFWSVSLNKTFHSWKEQRWQCEFRKAILKSACFLCLDFASALFYIIVFLTVWRVPFLIHNVREDRIHKAKAKEERQRKKDIEKMQKSYELCYTVPSYFHIHRYALVEFGILVIDFLTFLGIVLITATLWRIPGMVRKIKKHAKYEDPNTADSEDGESEDDVRDDIPEPAHPNTEASLVDANEVPLTPTNSPEEVENITVAVIEPGPQVTEDPSFCDKFFAVRGWRIRKAILMHIVGLFLDIPAFILLIINCASIYQIPFVFQRFLQAGDFYQEFLFIMIDETKFLCQDIIFFLLFLVVAIFRPIATWTNILEDKRHFRFRLSCEFLQQIRYIIKLRHKLRMELESDLSIEVKRHSVNAINPAIVRKRMIETAIGPDDDKSKASNSYIGQLEEIRDKMLKRSLDDRMIYLLCNICFYESKKPYLYNRRYMIESIYCSKPCPSARERNIQQSDKDLKCLNTKLEDFYSELESYKVAKCPLWSEKIGFFLRNRKQNQQVILKTITTGYGGILAVFLLNSLLLYRIPPMIFAMWKVRYSKVRMRDAAIHQTWEYGKDILALLKVFIVVLSVYRCPALISDLTHDLFSKQSITAARRTVSKYPIDIMKDLVDLFSLLCHWDTVVFIFASTLFIVLIPLSVIISTIAGSGINTCLVYILAFPTYLIVMGSPFVIVHKISEMVLEDGELDNQVISYSIAAYLALVTVLVGLFVIVKTKAQDVSEKVVKTIDYVRFNYFNAQVVGIEIIELLQLVAFTFTIRGLVIPYASGLREVAQWILLDRFDYRVRFSFLVILFVIWLCVCTVPTLMESVTKSKPAGHFSKNHFVWRSYLTFFGVTLFVTIPELGVSMLSCDYTLCSNATVCPSLFEDPNVPCWTGVHLIMAPLSFIMTVWYILTSLLYCLQFTDVTNQKVDLMFSPPYSALISVLKLILVATVSLFSEDKILVLAIVVGVLVVMITSSLVFPVLTGMKVCNSNVLLLWRIEAFVVALIVSGGVLVWELLNDQMEDTTETVLNYVIPGLTLLSVAIAAILSRVLSQTSYQEQARAEFKRAILRVVRQLEEEEKFVYQWRKVSKPFHRMLKVVRVARKNDKTYDDELSEEFVEMDNLPPPPAYDELDDNLLVLPPAYSEAVSVPVPASSLAGVDISGTAIPNPGVPGPIFATVEYPPQTADPVPQDNIPDGISSPEPSPSAVDDPYFIPGPAIYLKPVGAYAQFDAREMQKVLRLGFIYESPEQQKARELEMTDSHCNGVDLLLLLEQHVIYTAHSYEFVVNIQEWREKVASSTWIGLRDCVKELIDSLNDRFLRPRSIVKAEQADLIEEHTDTSHLPAYIPLTDVTEYKARIHKRETEKLMEILKEPWLSLFEKLLPLTGDPLIYKVTLGSEDDDNIWNLEVELFSKTEIGIRGIGPEGFKAAVGACIVLEKKVVLRRIRKWNNKLSFGAPFPVGKKGPLSHAVTGCGCTTKKGQFYLQAAGRSVALKKVLDTLNVLDWRFRD